ncbi:MAG: MogA/MoaB family molybdenum cofactor biosynthesis protein [Pirellulaceae bacterium]|nr:MogA/MoaB family molybdenum cofactor biosynthesis protein [Pirellulaceae bacterium]
MSASSAPQCSSSTQQHRDCAPERLGLAVITVSDTRTIETDRSGQLLVDSLSAAGHTIAVRQIVKDEPDQIVAAIQALRQNTLVDAVLLTGGTGLSPRDRTPEAVEPLLEAHIPGFGELFRWLSYQEIGAAAMLSRAFAGRMGNQIIFCLPGSTAAVRLALEKLLVPELPHLVFHARNP